MPDLRMAQAAGSGCAGRMALRSSLPGKIVFSRFGDALPVRTANPDRIGANRGVGPKP
jgi:hypothetical protein